MFNTKIEKLIYIKNVFDLREVVWWRLNGVVFFWKFTICRNRESESFRKHKKFESGWLKFELWDVKLDTWFFNMNTFRKKVTLFPMYIFTCISNFWQIYINYVCLFHIYPCNLLFYHVVFDLFRKWCVLSGFYWLKKIVITRIYKKIFI